MITQVSSQRTVWIMLPEPDDQLSCHPHITLKGKHRFQNSDGYTGEIPEGIVAIINRDFVREVIDYLNGLLKE